MRSVIATNALHGAQLSALVTALEANFPARLMFLIIQMSFASTGTVYVGNSLVTATFCGAELQPGGSVTMPIDGAGVLLTSDVWLLSTAATAQCNITALPIGE
jgi:hypothetical protein